MFPLPSRLQLELVLGIAALAFGWWLHTVWDGYKENQARKDLAEEHARAVAKDESAGLTFGTALNDIAAVTTAGLREIHHADLKPKPVTIYVEVPGQVVCPVRSQWTPDLVRLFNDPGQAAPTGDADGGDGAVRAAGAVAGHLPGAPGRGPEPGGGRGPAHGQGDLGDVRSPAEAARRPHQDGATPIILAGGNHGR